MNIHQNYKIFPGMSIGAKRICLRTKTGEENSRDTLSLTLSQVMYLEAHSPGHVGCPNIINDIKIIEVNSDDIMLDS
jgi:hypothetical protein